MAQAATAARMQGKLPAHISDMVDDLLYPVLDWRTILRDFIQSSAINNYRIVPPEQKVPPLADLSAKRLW